MNSNKIEPSIWGPHAWHILHNVSINSKMNNTTKDEYMNFIVLIIL